MFEWVTAWRVLLVFAMIIFFATIFCLGSAVKYMRKPSWIGYFPFIIFIPTNLHGTLGRKWLYYFYLSGAVLGTSLYIVWQIAP